MGNRSRGSTHRGGHAAPPRWHRVTGLRGALPKQKCQPMRITDWRFPAPVKLMIWKILKYAVIAIVCLAVVLLSSALLYRKYLQHSVAVERAITSPTGITSLERVRIGGIDQWIQVRGQDVDNPILLFVHGGPGVAFIPLAGSFQGAWEKHFPVVQWDQRGAGKSFASNDSELQRNTLTISRMQQDALEVVNYLRA